MTRKPMHYILSKITAVAAFGVTYAAIAPSHSQCQLVRVWTATATSRCSFDKALCHRPNVAEGLDCIDRREVVWLDREALTQDVLDDIIYWRHTGEKRS
jgi:hypothetical protein